MQITWFRHGHEARNDYFRYALMKKHLEGTLTYRELPQERGHDFGIPEALVQHDHRHTSILKVKRGNQTRLVAIDTEDGFIHLQPFIEEVDAYFCSPFTTAFHREKKFPSPLPWQTKEDVAPYRARTSDLIERYGSHFQKVRRLIPMPPRLADFGAMSHSQWRKAVWKHRFRRLQFWKDDRELWRHDYAACEARYNRMLSYRDLPLRYDVVCRETLWGWPDNRIKLHKRLHALKDNYDIHSQLMPVGEESRVPSWCGEITREDRSCLNELMQPMGLAENYETALGQSRIAVFPTGNHWGWRQIMFLGLCAGLPILMDPPLYEPYFNFDEFKVFYNEDSWGQIRDLIDEIDREQWADMKKKNQEVFDAYLSPESVGDYLHDELRQLLDTTVKGGSNE
jgi:hypothetical protein